MLLAFYSAMGSPAQARDLTADERAQLTKALAGFQTAMREKQFEQVLEMLPPRIYAQIGKQTGTDPAAMRKTVAQQMTKALKDVSVRSFSADLAKAEYRQLPNGTPYVLIPAEATMEAAAKTREAKSVVLAMIEGGAWHPLDSSNVQQVSIFNQAYPEFAGVQLGGKTTKAVP
ncbi:hypothetical protein AAII07_18400 [Microvirga sp. 0TCS3.31]